MAPSEFKTEHGYIIRHETVRVFAVSKKLYMIYRPGRKTATPGGYDTLAEAIGRANDMARGMVR